MKEEVADALDYNMYLNLIKVWVVGYSDMLECTGENGSIIGKIKREILESKPKKDQIISVDYKGLYSVQVKVLEVGFWRKMRYSSIDNCPYFKLEYLGICG